MSCNTISHAYVIFGATGNLAATKLLPALYQLDKAGHLAADVRILGCGRTPFTRESWQAQVREQLQTAGIDADTCLEQFIQRLDYLAGSLTEPPFYQSLGDWISTLGCENNVIFYLSVSPDLYITVTQGLSKQGLLAESHGWRRMVIEKPFGHDLASARDLQHQLDQHLQEEQIYRIDHYVGKESVQNLLVLRFDNLLLEPLWNRHYIDHVQIMHAETVGVEGRANYYDKSGGAMRDMIQSHLLQVLALLAMEPPVSMNAEALRDEKVKVLRAIRPMGPKQLATHTVRGQYTAGEIKGESVPGYWQEKDVAPASQTETFAALKLYVDNWRWRDVPFYLRTGKRLGARRSMVAVRFKEPPMNLFPKPGKRPVNWLLFGIQPEDAIRLEISAKVPGLDIKTRQIVMDASVAKPQERKVDAYEELLLDVIQGDRSLFLRYDEVKEAWNVVDPILQHWQHNASSPQPYVAGSWGPKAVDLLFAGEEPVWRYDMNLQGDKI